VDEDERQRADGVRARADPQGRHLRRRLLQRHPRRGGSGLSRAAVVGGVETGGTHVRCVIAAGPDDVRAETRVPTTTPAETLGRAVDFFRTHAERVAAVGIASFGPVDLDPASRTFGFVTTTPKPGWQRANVAGAFAALGVPVAFDTDVNGAALGEHRWGAGRGVDPFVYVTVGTGIGGGAIVHGRPLHGLAHPEMGHVLVARDPDDRFAGACPYHGACLEGLASGVALRERWGAPAETLPPAHPAWALEARYLALGVMAIAAVLSPRRIALGGGVMRAPGLLERVRIEVITALAGYVAAPELVAPALGERAGVLGAVALAQVALSNRSVQ
jgi:fructokinase